MADDELILPIEKCYWPKSVMRGLTPLLRQLGDRHGNLVIAAVPNKHIMVKGPADRIEGVKPELRELLEEHFPDAPIPEELGGGGEGEGEEEWAGEEEAAEEEPEPAAPEPPKAPAPAPAPAPKKETKASPAVKAAASSAKPDAKVTPPQWLLKQQGKKMTLEPEIKKAGSIKKVGHSTIATKKLEALKKGPTPESVSGRKQPRPAAIASPDLLWECTKFSSCFIRRPTRDLPRPFSAEPHNLIGLHALKFSGVAASEALNVRPKKEGKKESIELVQSHAKPSRHRRPDSTLVITGVNKCPKKGLARLDTEIGGKFYRKDLHELARIKYVKVQKSFKKKKVTVRSRRDGK